MHQIAKDPSRDFLANSTQYFYLVTDRNWNVLSSNSLFRNTFSATYGFDSSNFISIIHSMSNVESDALKQAERIPPVAFSVESAMISLQTQRWFKWEIEPILSDQLELISFRIIGHDITLQKQSIRHLWSKADLLDTLSDAVITSDLDYNILGWNKAAETIYGIPYSEAVGASLGMLKYNYPNESREEAQVQLKETGAWAGEVSYHRKDGKEIFLNASVTAVKDDQKNIIGYIAVNRDITATYEKLRLLNQQEQAERLLNKTQLQFISFMENTPAIAWMIDDRGTLVYANSPFLKTFSLSADAIGKEVRAVLPSHLGEIYIAGNMRVLAENRVVENIEETLSPDGKLMVFQAYRFPIDSFGNNRITGGKAFDITNYTRAQLELLKSNERYHYSTKATSDAIWDWEIAENKIYRSEGFTNLFGYTGIAVSPDWLFQHVHPDDFEKLQKSLEAMLHTDSLYWNMEYRFRCSDGSYKHVSDKAYVLRDANGKAIRMIGAMQDITGQRNLEKRLVDEESQKKQEIIQAIFHAQEQERRDIANELHDNVNQILSTCSLYLEVAQTEKDSIEYISHASTNIRKAIEEIRKISHSLNPAALEDIGLITAIKTLVQQMNVTRKMTVDLQITKIREHLLHSDMKLSLFRIVQEISNNIIRHSNANHVSIQLTVISKKIVLTFVDDGKGFDPTMIKRGLGLNNIITRAEYYKGSVMIRSAPSSGCTITITIPVHQ